MASSLNLLDLRENRAREPKSSSHYSLRNLPCHSCVNGNYRNDDSDNDQSNIRNNSNKSNSNSNSNDSDSSNDRTSNLATKPSSHDLVGLLCQGALLFFEVSDAGATALAEASPEHM